MRGLLRSFTDITFIATLFAAVAMMVVIGLDPASGRRFAHMWVGGLRVSSDEACPTAFGNAFWFDCASEVRARRPAPPPALRASVETASAAQAVTTADATGADSPH